jgi:dCMP deaminase
MEKARKDYLSWHNYFMGIVKLAALRSKDPSTQVGAIIVNDKNKFWLLVITGFPVGWMTTSILENRESEDWEDSKYPYVVHAEANAILNATTTLDNAKIYVSLFPCNECAKLIIQSGIKTVYYSCDKYNGTQINNVSKRLFKNSKVEFIEIPDVKVEVTVDKK